MIKKQAFIPSEYDKGIAITLPYYEDFFQQITDITAISLHKPVSWLDIGCGTGKMAENAFEKLKIKKMICCDISSEMLKAAKKRNAFSNIKFLEKSVQKIDYISEFDVITAILVNHYLSYEERLISVKNCYNALKKDGLYFTVENFAPDNEVHKSLYLERWKHYQYMNGKSEEECEKHILRYNIKYFPVTIKEQIKILNKCGFKKAEIFWCSYMQVGILAIK